jgi:hypothetical protein
MTRLRPLQTMRPMLSERLLQKRRQQQRWSVDATAMETDRKHKLTESVRQHAKIFSYRIEMVIQLFSHAIHMEHV